MFNFSSIECYDPVCYCAYIIICYMYSLFFSCIENNEGKLMLTPEKDGDTYVNGQVMTIDDI